MSTPRTIRAHRPPFRRTPEGQPDRGAGRAAAAPDGGCAGAGPPGHAVDARPARRAGATVADRPGLPVGAGRVIGVPGGSRRGRRRRLVVLARRPRPLADLARGRCRRDRDPTRPDLRPRHRRDRRRADRRPDHRGRAGRDGVRAAAPRVLADRDRRRRRARLHPGAQQPRRGAGRRRRDGLGPHRAARRTRPAGRDGARRRVTGARSGRGAPAAQRAGDPRRRLARPDGCDGRRRDPCPRQPAGDLGLGAAGRRAGRRSSCCSGWSAARARTPWWSPTPARTRRASRCGSSPRTRRSCRRARRRSGSRPSRSRRSRSPRRCAPRSGRVRSGSRSRPPRR